MPLRRILSFAAAAAILPGALFWQTAQAGDLRLSLPKSAITTPVQQLNRQGVQAVNKHQIDKAKQLFYKAYLLDPDDPFTLNNLGYISEVEGSVDRAQKFYALARERSFTAVVDQSNRPALRGKTVAQAAAVMDRDLQITRDNLEAMRSLQENHIVDAENTLETALNLDPGNPFTLNNLGLVKEKEGDLRGAMNDYQAAASRNSQDPAIVTMNRRLNGRPITEVSEQNERRVQQRQPEQNTQENQMARLNFQGVFAINRNDRAAARRYFQQAIALDPNDGFALNNMGYLSEMEGDPETAESYYLRAQDAERSAARVTAATRRDVLGMKLAELAQVNDQKVNAEIEAQRQAKRRNRVPIQLKRRDNTPVIEPATPNQ